VAVLFRRGKQVVKNIAPAIRPGGARSICIADVRDVPLDQLPRDADCGDLVSRVMGSRAFA
jgi:hypothetical protein